MVENCEGPPTGYDWKQFLARVRLVRLTRLDRRPWGGGQGLEVRGHTLTSKPANNHQPIIFISGCFLVWLLFHQLISFFPACFVALALHLEGLHLDGLHLEGLHLSISWGFLCPYFVDLKRQVATVSSVGRSLGLTQKHKKQSSASRYHVKLTCFSVIIFM